METGNSGHYVPLKYVNQDKNKKNSGVGWLWAIVIFVLMIAAYNYFKDTSKEGAKAPQNYSNYQSASSPDAGLTKSEIMQKYFPLKVGNSWTYKRTLIDPKNVFNYSEQTTVEPGWNVPEGIIYFTVGISLFKEKAGTSKETYTITGKDEKNYFKVQVKENENPRDGRYNDIYSYPKVDPNIRWKYVGKGVMEFVNGYYSDTKTVKESWLTLLDTDIIISNPTQENEPAPWEIGSTIYEEDITVPAGTFSNCIENIKTVGGSNITEIMKNGAPIVCSKADDFGCFVTKSYYAKNIGLVLEIQLDTKNNIVYRLELENYTIQ